MNESIEFKLNDRPVTVTGDSERILLWVLRTDLGVTGPKYGCGEGLCGACTVLVDGAAVLACQTAVQEVRGKEVVTIERLAKNGNLHPLQKAFIKHDALQCGYCTSGMILKAYSLLSENPTPSRAEIIAGMDEHLCRCGAHKRIIEAVEDAAQEMKGRMKS
jgi:nicotinate dehydrogenase subunit A